MAAKQVAIVLALALAGTSGTALAQGMTAGEAATLRAEIAALKAQVNALESRLDSAPASTPVVVAASPAKPAQPDVKITWKGAPEISTASGWSFKPRGRMQFDSGMVSAPSALSGSSTGFGTELRRLYLGAMGTIPGGFGYRFDLDFAPGTPEITDAYLTWEKKSLSVTVGQHYPFLSLEQQTSDLDTSFLERAAFNSAFNFERRVGLSAGYAKGPVMVNAGVFTDNIADLSSDANNSYSIDGRVVFMPKMGNAQLHFAGSAHWRDQNAVANARYRARPEHHVTDLRFVDTGALGVGKEFNYGLEAGAVAGPFHFAAEANWMRPTLRSGGRPTFFGGYAEVGYFITAGDSRPYKKGAWGAIKPANGLESGGPGAIQVNVRYDRVDLSDGGVIGGTQDGYLASIVWTPVEHIRFMANYGHLTINDAAVAAGTDSDYSVDVAGVRAQVDF